MLRLAVRVQREQAEIVLAELLELAPGGVEEVSLADDAVEYAIYGAPGELPALPDLTAAAGEALIEVRTTELEDGWAERWRQFHKPIAIGDALIVRPPWEPRPSGSSSNSIEIVIDPGQAFGTGAHPTTRMCLELMLELRSPRASPNHVAGQAPAAGSFVDLGCGSGVLAIAAAKLGWAPVLALDSDTASLDATARNAHLNEVELEIRGHDLRRDPAATGGTVAANLLRPLLLEYARSLDASSGSAPGRPLRPPGRNPPGRLIASGLLDHECDKVSAAFASRGMVELERRRSGEWAAVLLASE